MKKSRKLLGGLLSVILMLMMISGVCFANDGMPVLTFEHDSYTGSANSTITVGAHVTDPGNSDPMKGINVTFTLKDGNGKETALAAQTSDADGLVTCDVELGDAFPYTLTGSASDGVNLTTVTINSDNKTPAEEPAVEPEPEPEVDVPEDTTSDAELAAAAESAAEAQSGTNALIIILIVVIVIAAIIIIVVVSKKNKNKKA